MAKNQNIKSLLDRLAQFRPSGRIAFGVPRHNSGHGATAGTKRVADAGGFACGATMQKGIHDRRETQRTLQRAHVVHPPINSTNLGDHAAFHDVAVLGKAVLVGRSRPDLEAIILVRGTSDERLRTARVVA